jgi:hypothetical protein
VKELGESDKEVDDGVKKLRGEDKDDVEKEKIRRESNEDGDDDDEMKRLSENNEGVDDEVKKLREGNNGVDDEVRFMLMTVEGMELTMMQSTIHVIGAIEDCNCARVSGARMDVDFGNSGWMRGERCYNANSNHYNSYSSSQSASDMRTTMTREIIREGIQLRQSIQCTTKWICEDASGMRESVGKERC